MVKSMISAAFVTAVFVLIAPSAAAQQGCCSYHNGIDYCGSNGYYMCKDGTRSPTCTCGGSVNSLYDLQFKMIAAGTDSCDAIPELMQSTSSQLSQLNGQIESLNNQSNSAVNQIKNNQQKALESARVQSALTGGFGNSQGQFDSINNSYESQIQDTLARFGFAKQKVFLIVQEYTDFSNFLSKFQQTICTASINSTPNNPPVTTQQSTSSSSVSQASDGGCGKNTYYSNLSGCKCNPGFAWSAGGCVYAPPAIITNPAICISRNPCTCRTGYRPFGNTRCVPSSATSISSLSASKPSTVNQKVTSPKSSSSLPNEVACKKSGGTKTCQCPLMYKINKRGTKCVL